MIHTIDPMQDGKYAILERVTFFFLIQTLYLVSYSSVESIFPPINNFYNRIFDTKNMIC